MMYPFGYNKDPTNIINNNTNNNNNSNYHLYILIMCTIFIIKKGLMSPLTYQKITHHLIVIKMKVLKTIIRSYHLKYIFAYQRISFFFYSILNYTKKYLLQYVLTIFQIGIFYNLPQNICDKKIFE